MSDIVELYSALDQLASEGFSNYSLKSNIYLSKQGMQYLNKGCSLCC